MISRETIAKRVKALADEIAQNAERDKPLVIVGILTGAAFFLTDLVRELPEDLDVRVDFMSVASYGDSTKTSGVVRIFHDLKT
ncbi:MAG: hypoxanthine phosphoribosyltransferase, partial [Synergistaceae bacterium]|nr:hypoxanthine phosphoribosyltransferase [Synergistaceae bacterium]